MFDSEKVLWHQQAVDEQEVRKVELGKPNYNKRKMVEEMLELEEAIREAGDEVTRPVIEELGDFLFCLMGDEHFANALWERLNFNKERMRSYNGLDVLRAEINQIKMVQGVGWVRADGLPISDRVRALLDAE